VSQFSCFPAPAPSVISPLSLHDALPIYRLGLNLEYAAGRFQAHDDVLQRRTTVLRLFNFKSSACSSESGKAFGPSERAAAGLSCVSRKTPSTPAATAARASGSMNCGCPPLERPCPPGSCTECVTSKTTG